MRLIKKASLAIVILFFFSPAGRSQSRVDPLLAKLECPDRVKDVAFSPDGILVAAGYGWNDRAGIRIWNAANYSIVANLSVGESNIDCIAFSPDGKLFAAANWNGDVMLWRVGLWGIHKTPIHDLGSAEALTFSPDSSKFAFATENSAILYDLDSGKSKVLASDKRDQKSFLSISFSPDGRSLLVFRDEEVQVYEVKSGRLMDSWKPSGTGFFGNVSDDGNFVIAGGGAIYGKKSVEIWSTAYKKRIGELTGFRYGLFALAIAHSAKFFALGGGDYGSGGDLSLWSLSENPSEVGYVSFGEFPIDGLAFSPDDKILAAASNDNFVLLYDVARIRGPEIKKQNYALCGEIVTDGEKAFIVPLAKVPGVMSRGFGYAWRVEILNKDEVTPWAGTPVASEDWNIESSSDGNRARITKFRGLRPREGRSSLNHLVFGEVQNPGWNQGSLVKIYEDGSFVATTNLGQCVAYGSLRQFQTDFESIKKRLVDGGLLSLPRDPLSPGTDHFRTQFIELVSDGSAEVRSAVANRQAFARIWDREEGFINSLRAAGMKFNAPNGVESPGAVARLRLSLR